MMAEDDVRTNDAEREREDAAGALVRSALREQFQDRDERARALRGLATCLYRDLFEHAREAGHDRIVCEVNLDPPNPGSDVFHARMGFVEVGRTDLQPSGRTVGYWEKLL